MHRFLYKLVKNHKKQGQKGQILLMVVLATVITLTVGLSAISRTITNTRVSTEEANSQKALSAAEAGIEELLSNQSLFATGTTKTLSNNSVFETEAVAVSGTQIHINDGNRILKDDGADIWLTNYPDFSGSPWNGTLTIYWTNTGSACSGPAVEVAVIYGARANPSMGRYTADPCSTRNNNFSGALGGGTVLGKSFQNRISVPVTNGYIARVIPLYANTEMAVVGTSALPVQGYVIDSVGISGDATRKLRVFQGHPRLPIEFFPYNVFLP